MKDRVKEPFAGGAMLLLFVAMCACQRQTPYIVLNISSPDGIVHNIFLEQLGDEKSVTFEGADLSSSYDRLHHRYSLSGYGKVRAGTNTISISKTGVMVNGSPLARDVTNYVLDPSGRLREGFIAGFD